MADVFTIDEFKTRTGLFLARVTDGLPAINTIAAKLGLSLIKQRITEEGIDSKGKAIGTYSTNEVPFFFTKNGKIMAPYSSGALSGGAEDKVNKLKNPSKKAKGLAAALSKESGERVVPTLSYKEWREINGLQADYVSLKFSGDMWSDIDVISSELQGDTAVTIVTAKDTKKKGNINTSDKMKFNSERYGDIMALSEKEEQIVAKAFDAELQIMINQIFGQND